MKNILLIIFTLLVYTEVQAQEDSISIKKYISINHQSKNKKYIIFENEETNIFIIKNNKTIKLAGPLTIIDSLNLKINNTTFEITEIVKIERTNLELHRSLVTTGLLTTTTGIIVVYTTKSNLGFVTSSYGAITGLVITYYGLKAKHYYIENGKWSVSIKC